MRVGGGPAIRACPCYGAAGPGPASVGQAGQQGKPPARPLPAVAEERRVGCGGAALGDVVVSHPAGHQLLAVGGDEVDEPVTRAIGSRRGGVEGGGAHGDMGPRAASRLAILPDTTHVTLMDRMPVIVPMVNDFFDAKQQK